ncbi:neogenin-like isoform X2 [Denticeps clupeoides]|uniref:Neogenin-like n=1 Tax=Denticeps clupeoides TaxID=299321 RepID=A0AAY4D296_9TELE|nr:neogenin-like isoform X2 [Denticeps clupeoides]
MVGRALVPALLFTCFTCCALTADRDRRTVRRFSNFGFSVEPVDTVVVRGGPALLNCSVFSDAPARVQWRREGILLNLASDERRQLLPDGSLLISSVVHSKHNKPDEGEYQCVASIENLGTISSRTAHLYVASVARFSSQPEGASVQQGGSHVFQCDVNSDLVPFSRWERNREPVLPDHKLIRLPNGALLVSNASEEDAGLYRCLVETGGVVKISEEAELKILPEIGGWTDLEFLRQPSDVSKVMGDGVLLPCVVTGFPVPDVHWTHNGQPVEEREGHFEVVGGGSLQIFDLMEDDAGIFTCHAANANQSIQAQAELTVQVPPQFLRKPANISAHESADVAFECEVSGSPAPTIKWLKNGDAIIPDQYFRIVNDGSLQVLGLVKADEGFYQCLAENDAGNIQTSTQLSILEHDSGGPGRPTPSSPRDVVASLVSTRFIKLTWRLPAEPHGDDLIYSVYYSQDGTPRERVLNTTHPGEMQVTIQNLLPDTKYAFQVVAHNRNGQGERSIPLRVSTQPEVQLPGPAPNLQAVVTSPSSITVSWGTPATGNGEIQNYKLYYNQKGQDVEQDVDVRALSYTLTALKKFTEYSLRVVAYNKHGPGVSTDDVVVQTFSDVPSSPPQNLILEVLNSKSIMARWQPPPGDMQNGDITGYKIRYRKAGRKNEVTEIAAPTQLTQLLDSLQRGTEYSVRVSALTVNGSGPATDWVTAETFESELDESRVPDMPSSLHVRSLVNSIVVSWTPPDNPSIVVRGYSIGYGIGSPHSQTIKVDYKQRFYTIEHLEPSSHYVIMLKAYNNMGEGVPVYESAITRPQSDPIDPDVDFFELFHAPYTPVPDPTPMLPPVGVQSSVLSHDTIKVTWADNSLAKNQKITDARYYTVRWKTNIPANTKFKATNTTTLSHTVSGLKPNTLYEFSVMVTKGRRNSMWSMTAHGTTLESSPSTAPKDVTVVSKEGRPRTIIVNWQPPSEANGKITGYIIYYNTDVNAEMHDWVIEPVMGNRLTHQIHELTLDTSYYFKIQARNSKGMGPMSDAVHFRTPKATGILPKSGGPDAGPVPSSGIGPSDSHILVIVIIVSVGVFTIIVVVVGAFLCTRRTTSHQKKRATSKSSNGSHKYKSTSKDLKPPDLWIHHERLELKPMDKSPEPNPVMTDTPIPRSAQDIIPADSSLLLQRRNSYRGHDSEDNMSTLTSCRGMRTKMMMPFDAQPPQPVVSAHPIHSLDHHPHHYHPASLASPAQGHLPHQLSSRPITTPISHVHRPDSSECMNRNTPSSDLLPAASSQAPSLADHHSETDVSYHSSATEEEPPSYPPTAHVRPTHPPQPMKSFTVPAVPSHNTSYEAAALPSTPLLPHTGLQQVKMECVGTLGRTRSPMSNNMSSVPDGPETGQMLEDSENCYNTDVLTQEMAHLEGLMKDLNAIPTD